jgi:hypothetical protein
MIDLNAQPKHLLTQGSLPDKVLWLTTFIQKLRLSNMEKMKVSQGSLTLGFQISFGV